MHCPHCQEKVHVEKNPAYDVVEINVSYLGAPPDRERNMSEPSTGQALTLDIGADGSGYHWWLKKATCPHCKEFTFVLLWERGGGENAYYPPEEGERMVWPRNTGRPPIPPEVPSKFKKDYLEACCILDDSRNASAATSRRCLQMLLVEKLGAPSTRTLYAQIQWVIDNADIPSSVVELLDYPRQIGNKGAHPEISEAGVIVDVELWEALWCLEIIEALYDCLFVKPARHRERMDRLAGNMHPNRPD